MKNTAKKKMTRDEKVLLSKLAGGGKLGPNDNKACNMLISRGYLAFNKNENPSTVVTEAGHAAANKGD